MLSLSLSRPRGHNAWIEKRLEVRLRNPRLNEWYSGVVIIIPFQVVKHGFNGNSRILK